MAKTKPKKRVAIHVEVRPETMATIRDVMALAEERGTMGGGSVSIGHVARRAIVLGLAAARKEAEGVAT